MKFLIAVTPEYVLAQDRDKYAPDGEPVIPWYPAPLDNQFLSVISFRRSIHALVADLPAFNVDDALTNLMKQYPGLPRRLHANYLMHTARAAQQFPVGTRFRIFITADSAKLHEIGVAERLFTLWEEQPV